MKTVIFLLLLLLAQVRHTTAQTVYVSNTGVDASGYGSMSLPYHTIQYAYNQVTSGGTIKVQAGAPYSVSGTINISKPITITKYGTGEVVLDASGWIGNYKHFFNISGTSHVMIDSLAMVNCMGYGSAAVYVNGACDSVVISRCRIRNIGYQSNDLTTAPTNSTNHNAHAIHVVGDAINPITHCIITGCNISNCATGYSEAITLTGYVDSFLVENNFIDSIQNIGIVAAGNYSPGAGYLGNSNPAKNQARNGIIRSNMVSHCMSALRFSAGIYIDGAINCRLEGNKCLFNGVGISIGAEQPIPSGYRVFGNIVDNNIITDNAMAGMLIGSTTSGATVFGTIVSNNTFYKNRNGATINGISQVGSYSSSQYGDNNGGEVHFNTNDSTLFQNNIVHAINAHQNLLVLLATAHYRADYNDYFTDNNSISLEIVNGTGSINGLSSTGYWYSTGSYRSSFSLDSNSIQADPKYANASIGNFNLKHGSLAINSGTPLYNVSYGGASDYSGSIRVVNGRIDIGALESLCPRAVASASGTIAFCQGDSVILNANNGSFYSYQWQLNGVNLAGALSADYHADSNGNYRVVVQSNGCSDTSSSISVVVYPLPTPIIIRIGSTLTSSTSGVSYTWYLNGVVVYPPGPLHLV